MDVKWRGNSRDGVEVSAGMADSWAERKQPHRLTTGVSNVCPRRELLKVGRMQWAASELWHHTGKEEIIAKFRQFFYLRWHHLYSSCSGEMFLSSFGAGGPQTSTGSPCHCFAPAPPFGNVFFSSYSTCIFLPVF